MLGLETYSCCLGQPDNIFKSVINLKPVMLDKDNEYTSLDFLSKIRLQPKRQLFRQLSLDTDLEEINQVLSPKQRPGPTAAEGLDRTLTKRFVQQLIRNYEGQAEAESKWDAFLKSIETPQSFELFFSSLKDIREPRKEEPAVNPENQPCKQPAALPRKIRSLSSKKANPKPQQKPQQPRLQLKQKMRQEIAGLKDLLLAGERFVHSE